MAVVGTGIAAWPFVAALDPAKDTLASSTIDVDLSPVQEGQAVTVMWRGKPVFIRHRTAAEIALARKVEFMAGLGIFPATTPAGLPISYGVTNVVLTFDDSVTDYFARSQVIERLRPK